MLLADLPITHQTPNTHSCHYTSSSQEKMQSAWFDSAVSPTIKMQEDDITFERYTIPKSESIFEEQESQQTREIKSHRATERCSGPSCSHSVSWCGYTLCYSRTSRGAGQCTRLNR